MLSCKSIFIKILTWPPRGSRRKGESPRTRKCCPFTHLQKIFHRDFRRLIFFATDRYGTATHNPIDRAPTWARPTLPSTRPHTRAQMSRRSGRVFGYRSAARRSVVHDPAHPAITALRACRHAGGTPSRKSRSTGGGEGRGGVHRLATESSRRAARASGYICARCTSKDRK